MKIERYSVLEFFNPSLGVNFKKIAAIYSPKNLYTFHGGKTIDGCGGTNDGSSNSFRHTFLDRVTNYTIFVERN